MEILFVLTQLLKRHNNRRQQLFGSFTNITNNVITKNSNKFFGQLSIGSLGEMGSKGDIFKRWYCKIGNNNVLENLDTINHFVRRESTEIGNNCYFMARSHIPRCTNKE